MREGLEALHIIEICQNIGTDFGCYSSDKFKEDLERVPQDRKNIYLEINSAGGSLWETFVIMGLMAERKEKTNCSFNATTISLTASASTLIYLSCDYRLISKSGVFMIHTPTANCYGHSDEFEFMRKILVEAEEEMIEFYQKKLPRVEPSKVKEWIKGRADNYFDADECLAMGISHQIIQDKTRSKPDKATAIATARDRFQQEQKKYQDSISSKIKSDVQLKRSQEALKKSLFPEIHARNMILQGLKTKNKLMLRVGKQYMEKSRKGR